MSNKSWTDDQLAAIETKGTNLLVAAGAGSGKTAVLVERIIRLLTGPEQLSVDRLLVVTFTKAAAAEMRERIAAALEALAEQNPQDNHILTQLALLPQAAVMTCHS
ncbi:MAG: UvrD-helicase domain-containing protein, partial [Pygmaiobacter sp.]|nr:UvrD-helicase domain-containing protein [Pygmaiobacter sp.]